MYYQLLLIHSPTYTSKYGKGLIFGQFLFYITIICNYGKGLDRARNTLNTLKSKNLKIGSYLIKNVLKISSSNHGKNVEITA